MLGKENYCATQTITFNYPYNRGPNGKGSISRGGFAKYWRGPSKFAAPFLPASSLTLRHPCFVVVSPFTAPSLASKSAPSVSASVSSVSAVWVIWLSFLPRPWALR